MILVIVFVAIFEFGGRQHFLMRDMINKKTGDERVKLGEMIFGNKDENVSGGIIIGVNYE